MNGCNPHLPWDQGKTEVKKAGEEKAWNMEYRISLLHFETKDREDNKNLCISGYMYTTKL